MNGGISDPVSESYLRSEISSSSIWWVLFFSFFIVILIILQIHRLFYFEETFRIIICGRLQ